MPTRTLTYSPSRTLLTVVYDYSTGSARAWRTDTHVFEAFVAGHAASYGVETDPAGIPGEYQWAVPGLPALAAPGEYKAVTYDVTGTTLAAALAGTPVAVWLATFGWDGTTFTSPATEGDVEAAVAGLSGTGALAVTIAVTDGTNPVQGATVRATINGQTAGVGTTGSGGTVVLSLNAGTYTVTATAAGFAGATQAAVVAAGQQTVAVALAADVVPTAPPGEVTGTLQVATPGAVATFQQRTDPAGLPCNAAPFTVAADGTLVTVSLTAGVRYAYSVGTGGVRRLFNTPSSGSFDITAAAAAYLP